MEDIFNYGTRGNSLTSMEGWKLQRKLEKVMNPLARGGRASFQLPAEFCQAWDVCSEHSGPDQEPNLDFWKQRQKSPSLSVPPGLSYLVVTTLAAAVTGKCFFFFLTFYFFDLFFIRVELIYSVESISAVQQSDPVTHIYILFSYDLPSWSSPRDWIWFSALYSRTPLLILSKC